MSFSRALRAAPTMLRIGVAETVAYRAEFLVWILTTTLPLVMLALWSSVAAEGPFRGYTSNDFVAYYLANLIVRQLTGNWVGWQISEEIRTGTMAMRLLRPIHPFFAFAFSHVAAIPFRSAIAVPIATVLLFSSGSSSLTTDPAMIAMVVASIALAWMLTFAFLFALGSLAFYLTKAMALFNLYFGLFTVLSGYLIPIDLMPHWLATTARWSPFRYMLSAPVELLVKRMAYGDAALILGQQAIWVAILLATAFVVWNRGVRRFEAVGS